VEVLFRQAIGQGYYSLDFSRMSSVLVALGRQAEECRKKYLYLENPSSQDIENK
jgi:hypothetical protein